MANTQKPSSKSPKSQGIEQLLGDSKYRIQLHTLVQKQSEEAYKSVEELNVQVQDVMAEAQKSIANFEKSTNILPPQFPGR